MRGVSHDGSPIQLRATQHALASTGGNQVRLTSRCRHRCSARVSFRECGWTHRPTLQSGCRRGLRRLGLAGSGGLMSLSGRRRQKVCEASALKRPPELLCDCDALVNEELLSSRRRLKAGRSSSIPRRKSSACGDHPPALLRPLLAKRRLMTGHELEQAPNGGLVHHSASSSCSSSWIRRAARSL